MLLGHMLQDFAPQRHWKRSNIKQTSITLQYRAMHATSESAVGISQPCHWQHALKDRGMLAMLAPRE
jgi:hypothetical protein